MRFLSALLLVLAVTFAGLLAATSCVLDYRNPDASTDGPGPEGGSAMFGDGASEGNASEADLDCGCCTQSVLPLLPSCSGNVAFEFPAADCKVPCAGRIAYALCEGECYAACACDLPAGYMLLDAGFVIGDGSPTEAEADAGDAGASGDGSLEGGTGGRDGGGS